MKRLRPVSVPYRAPSPARPVKSRIDIVLTRISHLSQLGLLFFTVGAIYFTVIPLYQKALLDESIARKEIELRELQTRYAETYAANRKFVVANFIFHAGVSCSGLMDPPGTPSEHVFDIDPVSCLERQRALSAIASLEPNDVAVIDSSIALIGARLKVDRVVAAERYRGAEKAAPNLAVSQMSPFTRSLAEEQLILANPATRATLKRTIEVQHERLNAVVQYRDAMHRELNGLRNLRWTSASATKH